MKKLLLLCAMVLAFMTFSYAQNYDFESFERLLTELDQDERNWDDDDYLDEDDYLWDEIWNQAVYGPAVVDLGGIGQLNLPAEMIFLPADPAELYSYYYVGNSENERLVGIVVSEYEDEYWIAYIDYNADGYISDKDAKKWNAKNLLKDYKKGTEEANADRIARGIPILVINGWLQEPVYDADTKTLTLAFDMDDYVEDSDIPDKAVNYNVYKLGRYGYFEISFATGFEDFEYEKELALDIVDNIYFNDGMTYADYNPAVDGGSIMSLTSLITGMADEESSVARFVVIGLIALIIIIVLAVVFVRKANKGSGRGSDDSPLFK